MAKIQRMKKRENGQAVEIRVRVNKQLKEKFERYCLMQQVTMSLAAEQIIKRFLEEKGM